MTLLAASSRTVKTSWSKAKRIEWLWRRPRSRRVNLARRRDVVIRRPVLNEGDDPGRVRQLIAAVVVLVALVAAGLWLTGRAAQHRAASRTAWQPGGRTARRSAKG